MNYILIGFLVYIGWGFAEFLLDMFILNKLANILRETRWYKNYIDAGEKKPKMHSQRKIGF